MLCVDICSLTFVYVVTVSYKVSVTLISMNVRYFPIDLLKSCTRCRANAEQIARLVFPLHGSIERTTNKKEQVEEEQDENVRRIEREREREHKISKINISIDVILRHIMQQSKQKHFIRLNSMINLVRCNFRFRCYNDALTVCTLYAPHNNFCANHLRG